MFAFYTVGFAKNENLKKKEKENKKGCTSITEICLKRGFLFLTGRPETLYMYDENVWVNEFECVLRERAYIAE